MTETLIGLSLNDESKRRGKMDVNVEKKMRRSFFSRFTTLCRVGGSGVCSCGSVFDGSPGLRVFGRALAPHTHLNTLRIASQLGVFQSGHAASLHLHPKTINTKKKRRQAAVRSCTRTSGSKLHRRPGMRLQRSWFNTDEEMNGLRCLQFGSIRAETQEGGGGGCEEWKRRRRRDKPKETTLD